MKVLLVDDDTALLELNTVLLTRAGILVETATSAKQARQLVEANRYAACLLDMLLPDGSGAELAREFLRDQPGLRVVMISAFRGLGQAELARLPNVVRVLNKPVKADQLVSALREAVAGTPPPRPSPLEGKAPVRESTPGPVRLAMRPPLKAKDSLLRRVVTRIGKLRRRVQRPAV